MNDLTPETGKIIGIASIIGLSISLLFLIFSRNQLELIGWSILVIWFSIAFGMTIKYFIND
jgi:hypothetical protein